MPIVIARGWNGHLSALAFAQDGRTMLSAGACRGQDLLLGEWGFEPLALRRSILVRGAGQDLDAFALAPGGRAAAVAGSKKRLSVVALDGAAPERPLRGYAERISAVVFHPGGGLFSGGHDRAIRVWEPARGRCLQVLAGHAGPVAALLVHPDGRLISGDATGLVGIWARAPLSGTGAG
jgi:COMPASS component SWD3